MPPMSIPDRVDAEMYSEICQTFKMERFTKIVNGFYLLTIFAQRFILVAWNA